MLKEIKQKHWYFRLRWLFISLIVVLMDQISKSWVLETLHEGESRPIFPFFNLVLYFNRGAAFSFLSSASGWQHYFFITIAIVASLVIIYLLLRHYFTNWYCFALSLILGGAIGNLCDRLTHAGVVDYLDLYIGSYHWPSFNIADSAISLGVMILFIFEIKNSKNKQKE
jgi:signal peptidase II